jgi:Domain of unknown function (DUF4399)
MLGRPPSWLRWARLSAFVSSRTKLEKNEGKMMPLARLALLCAALALLPAAALAQGKATPKDALLYIIYPEDGATVKGPFWCRFGLRNMGVAPAGSDFSNTGHHHLMIDASEPIDPNEPIPHDKTHLHFGGGETEALLDLPPGKHTLQLVLGDSNHFPFNPPLISKKITITVKADDDSDSDDDRKKSRHRSYFRMHRTHFASARRDQQQVEPTPNNDGKARCPYRGLWALLTDCQDAASAPVKPAAAPSSN